MTLMVDVQILTLHNCCPDESSSNGCLEKHFEHAKSGTLLLILL